MTEPKKESLTYQDAGVDIERGNALVKDIKQIAKRTHRSGVMDSIGGFGALFEIPDYFNQPVLVSSTDGVGTKLKLATALNQHHTIGIDLVAMCVNDIITLGAEPLFFLDYFATGQLDSTQANSILTGIGRGCELAGCALIGGETAEMPGMYQGGDYDLAGFSVGAVEKNKIIKGDTVTAGDVLIGLASSGPHSNGYSLIRRVVEQSNSDFNSTFAASTLGETLLTPTRIYVSSLLTLLNTVPVLAMAHITGGGLTDNLPRMLPANCHANIDFNSWEWPAIFQWLQQQGNIVTDEMIRTFNVGVGMVICVAKNNVDQSLDILQQQGEHAWIIGAVDA